MNKKVMILVVILECALSILLISVVGMAIETLNNETEAVDIRFTTAEGVLLEPGMLYKEKEGTTEEIKNDQLVIEVYRPDRGYSSIGRSSPRMRAIEASPSSRSRTIPPWR